MKRAVAVALAATTSIAAAQTKDQPGRWELFQGEYRFVNIKGEEHWIRALFKIDTATGKLYECRGWQYDGDDHGKPGMEIQSVGCTAFESEIVTRKKK